MPQTGYVIGELPLETDSMLPSARLDYVGSGVKFNNTAKINLLGSKPKGQMLQFERRFKKQLFQMFRCKILRSNPYIQRLKFG